MSRIKVTISDRDVVSGEQIDPGLLAENSPALVAFGERYGEFLLALGADDDLALIARACALCEMYLRKAIDARLEKPDALTDAWRRIPFSLRVQLGVAMELIPAEMQPLLTAIGRLRNLVLHDTPHGAISENSVTTLRRCLPKEADAQFEKMRANSLAMRNKITLLPHQHEFRVILLFAYATCLAAAQRADTIKLGSAPQQASAEGSPTDS